MTTKIDDDLLVTSKTASISVKTGSKNKMDKFSLFIFDRIITSTITFDHIFQRITVRCSKLDIGRTQ